VTYIGSKRRLIPFIDVGVERVRARLGKSKLVIADLFSGSGASSRYFKQHSSHLIVNDLESYARVLSECFLSNRSELCEPELAEIHRRLASRIEEEFAPGFIAELYAPRDDENIRAGERVFYTRRNASFLDTACRVLSELGSRERSYFLGPLLAKASVHVNTSGVFKGFYKNSQGCGQFGGSGKDALQRILAPITFERPFLSKFSCPVSIYQEDTNRLAAMLPEVDLVYLDPPYNQHPYGSNYFMLNLLVDYERPAEVSVVSGIPKRWNRSQFNQRQCAEHALNELVDSCKAKFLLLSFNSEGFVKKQRLEEILARLGRVEVLETSYNTFRGSRNLSGRPIHVKEYLFLLEKN
jgi:adenine-specific DNA-methyltransferase